MMHPNAIVAPAPHYFCNRHCNEWSPTVTGLRMYITSIACTQKLLTSRQSAEPPCSRWDGADWLEQGRAAAFTRRRCRADSAVTAAVDAFAPMEIGVGDLKLKAEGAVAAGLTRLVMAQANEVDWGELPAALTEQLERVFVNNLEQMLEAMLLPLLL
ncbi:hypothetical protein niasHT_019145 [Heterodera trifolii]|uniref:Lon proteolytic domain-containing protein n=1 Tax=Heterodera trifolii TaxID=157864 RepID=A0ABD2KX56_9BILA